MNSHLVVLRCHTLQLWGHWYGVCGFRLLHLFWAAKFAASCLESNMTFGLLTGWPLLQYLHFRALPSQYQVSGVSCLFLRWFPLDQMIIVMMDATMNPMVPPVDPEIPMFSSRNTDATKVTIQITAMMGRLFILSPCSEYRVNS